MTSRSTARSRNKVNKRPARAPAKPRRKASKKVKLLTGGNPQIPKADGDAPVQAYIAALSGWKQDTARKLDALISKSAPKARKAVKWNSPFYGMEGQGWFVSFHVFTRYIKVTFFKGTSLKPPPAGGSGKEGRWVDVHEGEFDAAQLAKWIKQAAKLPGWLG